MVKKLLLTKNWVFLANFQSINAQIELKRENAVWD